MMVAMMEAMNARPMTGEKAAIYGIVTTRSRTKPQSSTEAKMGMRTMGISMIDRILVSLWVFQAEETSFTVIQ